MNQETELKVEEYIQDKLPRLQLKSILEKYRKANIRNSTVKKSMQSKVAIV